MNAPATLIKTADTNVPAPTFAFSPIVLSAPDRGQDLHLRVSAPSTGNNLPVILMAHGFAKSMRDYTPHVDFWALR